MYKRILMRLKMGSSKSVVRKKLTHKSLGCLFSSFLTSHMHCHSHLIILCLIIRRVSLFLLIYPLQKGSAFHYSFPSVSAKFKCVRQISLASFTEAKQDFPAERESEKRQISWILPNINVSHLCIRDNRPRFSDFEDSIRWI